jgi:basic membrane protein A
MSDEMPLSDGNNVVGFVGGMDSPASRAGAAGFLAGAKYANPNVELIYTIAGGYRDPSKGKEIALAAYDKGADVVSHNAGGTGLGVFDAAAEVNKYVIGSSLSSIDVDRSLCTSMKRTDLFVFQEIEAIVNGTWKAGSDRKGLAEGVCYYDVENLNTVLPEKIVAAVEEIKNRVISGEVKLVNDPSEIEAWSKVNFY